MDHLLNPPHHMGLHGTAHPGGYALMGHPLAAANPYANSTPAHSSAHTPPTPNHPNNLAQQEKEEVELQCSKCDFTTFDRKVLETHMGKGHGKVKVFKCKEPGCSYTAPEIFRLQRHCRSIHMEKVYKFFCTMCDYKGLRKDYLDNHVKKTHATVKEFECHLCSYATSRKESLASHIVRIHENKKSHTCPICPYACNTKQTLNAHIRAKHEKKKEKGEEDWANIDPNDPMQMCDKLQIRYCKICDISLSSKTALRMHLRRKHPEIKLHRCKQCDYATCSRRELNAHVRASHDPIRDHFCTKCDFAGATHAALSVHTFMMHSDRHQFKCQHCEYQTPRHEFLLRHIDRKHKDTNNMTKEERDEENQIIFCKHCNFQCYDSETLENHLLRHKLETVTKKKQQVNNFRCENCNLPFHSAKKLQLHVEAVHAKPDVLFGCDQCEFVGPNESDLKHHVFMCHKKYYFFRCDKCDFQTKIQTELRKHLESRHQLSLDFQCPFCDISRDTKRNLYLHIQKNHSDLATKPEPVEDVLEEERSTQDVSNLCEVTIDEENQDKREVSERSDEAGKQDDEEKESSTDQSANDSGASPKSKQEMSNTSGDDCLEHEFLTDMQQSNKIMSHTV